MLMVCKLVSEWYHSKMLFYNSCEFAQENFLYLSFFKRWNGRGRTYPTKLEIIKMFIKIVGSPVYNGSWIGLKYLRILNIIKMLF